MKLILYRMTYAARYSGIEKGKRKHTHMVTQTKTLASARKSYERIPNAAWPADRKPDIPLRPSIVGTRGLHSIWIRHAMNRQYILPSIVANIGCRIFRSPHATRPPAATLSLGAIKESNKFMFDSLTSMRPSSHPCRAKKAACTNPRQKRPSNQSHRAATVTRGVWPWCGPTIPHR